MKVFVTGGSGFVGRHFLMLCEDAGIAVKALVRRDSASELPDYDCVEWLHKNLDEVSREDFADCELLLHMASHTANPPYASFTDCVYWNVYSVMKLFETGIEAGVSRFVNIGTCFEYADCQSDGGVSKDSVLGAIESYPASKAAASIVLEAWAKKTGASLATLRLFQVYGEGEKSSRLYPSLKKAALAGQDFKMSDGKQVRDFIEVKEVAKAICFALKADEIFVPGAPSVYHVAKGRPQTVAEFAQEKWREFGATGNLLLGSLPRRKGQFESVYSDQSSLLERADL